MSNWLRYSPTSGHGNGTITITADTLSELEDRVATIVASNSQYGISDSVLITQNTVASSIPLTFDIISGGTIVWKYFNDDNNEKTISYSNNDGEWVEITSSKAGTQINVSAGDVIKFKGNNSDYFNNAFQTTGGTLFTVQGNIMSLVDGESFATTKILPGTYTFFRLFLDCSGLVSAENLSLPATTLTTGCYSNMFQGCTSLTTAPALPATTLANYCYYSMFSNCTSLTQAPVLPATTLADYCYENMFNKCSSLTTVPALPATTLAYDCYRDMFRDCTSLTTAPVLPATTLASYCYQQMFYGCTKLTTAPVLPAINLEESCYIAMFHSCTSLTTAPELPATILAKGCYSYMFYGCTSLTTAPSVLPATNLENDCYSGMFDGCTSLTTAPALPATTLARNCYSGMFSNCTSLTAAPALPATTLTEGCYSSMFYGCTSLTTAPELPATTLICDCYPYMFQNCTSLNYIKCLATEIDEKICYKTTNWLDNVSPTGTFVKSKNMTGWTSGVSRIPEGWTVIDAT